MNALKIFKNFANLSGQETGDFVKKEYRKLRAAIFFIMPDGCFLKMWNTLDLRMVFMLSPEMIEKGVVSQKDVCTLCSAESCPFNNVDHKDLRIVKVKLLGNIYNR